jgi:predicted RNA-binding protein YlqC (UPF0109 family)
MHEATEIVKRMAENIVSHPSAMAVAEDSIPGKLYIEIVPSPYDAGKLIGKQGRIFRAFQWLLENISRRTGEKITLHRIAASGHFREDLPPFKAMMNWPENEFRRLAASIARALFDGTPDVAVFNRGENSDLIFRVPMQDDIFAAEFEEHIGKLFNAAGMKHGRIITVTLDKSPAQPMAADGRFARELKQ